MRIAQRSVLGERGAVRYFSPILGILFMNAASAYTAESGIPRHFQGRDEAFAKCCRQPRKLGYRIVVRMGRSKNLDTLRVSN